jgi:hypothetical protein
MPTTFRTERDGRVLTVLFDAPPHNFMGRRMVDAAHRLARRSPEAADTGCGG